MDVFLILAFGITNGVFFTPPSEYVYFYIFDQWGYGEFAYLFTMANTVGHIILFQIFLRYSNHPYLRHRIVMKYINQFSALVEKVGAERAYLVWFRCLPFLHTFVSIIAALKREDRKKFIILTLFGNVAFLHVNFAFFWLSDYARLGFWEKILALTFVIVVAHVMVNWVAKLVSKK